MDGPPFVEGFIGSYIKTLFGWRSFSECVGYVGAVDQHVLASGDGVEELGAGLVKAVCICFVEDLDVARSGGAVTYASRFLAFVGGFNCVCPYEMEDSVVGVCLNWVAKHALVVVLIEL